jgi:hypothetical protein
VIKQLDVAAVHEVLGALLGSLHVRPAQETFAWVVEHAGFVLRRAGVALAVPPSRTTAEVSPIGEPNRVVSVRMSSKIGTGDDGEDSARAFGTRTFGREEVNSFY